MRYIISAALAIVPLPAMADVPQVITDIPAVHALVSQVMGDLGTPVLLLSKGADEHDFQLKPSQMGNIAAADMVVWIGPDLTPWLERALQSAPTSLVNLTLMTAPGTVTLNYAEDGGLNPHMWLEPGNAALWTKAISGALAKADPEHASTYAANAAAATADLSALDGEIAAILAPVKDRPFVTYHDAFAYFVQHYGLTQAGSVAVGDASAPGAARLAALKETIATKGVVCLFPEEQHDDALITQMLNGSTAKLGAPLDPVGSTLPPGPMAYDALLRSIATALANCLNAA